MPGGKGGGGGGGGLVEENVQKQRLPLFARDFMSSFKLLSSVCVCVCVSVSVSVCFIQFNQ